MSTNTNCGGSGHRFLPLCDLLFNLVSVTTYFCDLIFVLILANTLLLSGQATTWFLVVVLAMCTALFCSQLLSLRFFFLENGPTSSAPTSPRTPTTSWLQIVCVASHVCFCGVLFRYARLLFLPIRNAEIKQEMRTLSLLRLMHAFLLDVVVVLVTLHLLLTRPALISFDMETLDMDEKVAKMTDTQTMLLASASASLTHMAWSLASFNKHIRDLSKLVLTWMGVLSQLIWRLGTLTARFMALSLYASIYGLFLVLVLFLHYSCMMLWLVLLARNESKEKNNQFTKSALLAYVYCFDFVNIESDVSSAKRMAVYYFIVGIENLLLLALWATHVHVQLVFDHQDRLAVLLGLLGSVTLGLGFMLVYYRLCHVGTLRVVEDTSEQRSFQRASNTKNILDAEWADYRQQRPTMTTNTSSSSAVFNCALASSTNKKKKIPRQIPPLPDVSKPFWKQPLPQNFYLANNNNALKSTKKSNDNAAEHNSMHNSSSGEHGDVESEEAEWSASKTAAPMYIRPTKHNRRAETKL